MVFVAAMVLAIGAAPQSDGQILIFEDDFECGDTCGWDWPNPEPASVAGMTSAHNSVRASVDPPASPSLPPLTWDNDVAAIAQAWADTCVWYHRGSPYGENMAAFAGWSGSPQAVADIWGGEAVCYDYGSNTCDVYCQPEISACGHYTQMVWRSSVRFGCGVRTCTSGSPFPGYPTWTVWVCDYDPPGNFVGQSPY